MCLSKGRESNGIIDSLAFFLNDLLKEVEAFLIPQKSNEIEGLI